MFVLDCFVTLVVSLVTTSVALQRLVSLVVEHTTQRKTHEGQRSAQLAATVTRIRFQIAKITRSAP